MSRFTRIREMVAYYAENVSNYGTLQNRYFSNKLIIMDDKKILFLLNQKSLGVLNFCGVQIFLNLNKNQNS